MNRRRPLFPRKPGSILPVVGIVLLSLLAAPPRSQAAETPPAWSTSASLALKEEFDDDVYLQDRTALANRSSLVTTAIPSVGLRHTGDSGPRISVSYAPEVVFFHSEPEEDFVLHRFGMTGGGSLAGADLEVQGSVVAVDGSDISPTYFDAGGSPAGGGPRVRDRRDATIYRGSWKATRTFSGWILRPLATAYLHDFQTRRSRSPGYVNYVDRNEVVVGLDAGRSVTSSTKAYLGYRYGWQDQAHLFDFPEEDDNEFQRILAVVEGTPWSWLKAAMAVGPEFRRYGDKVPTLFGSRNENNLYVDATLTVIAATNQVVTASARLFEQPGFLGRAAYEDLTYDLVWRWKFDGRTALVTSGRAYNTDFHVPSIRNDWIFTTGVALARDFTRQFQAEISYTHEVADSLVSNTPGREYSRNVVAIGLKYLFR